MYTLESKSQQVLSDIFTETTTARDGVDALKYRANHADQLDLLNQLEQDGYLRREQDKYWVSLTALPQLDLERAARLLEHAEEVFACLKAYYKENQRDQMKLTELAQRVGLELDEIKECLSYMIEGSWWGSRTTDFYSGDDPHIKPSEAILRYSRFRDVLDQLRQWQDYRIQARASPPVRITKVLSQKRSCRLPTFLEQSREREKPLWYGTLSSDLQSILDEVYLALSLRLRALTAMGLRTVIDMVCDDHVGDKGGFSQKLDALENKGCINANEKAILEIAIDVGSASAHRGHNPSLEDLNTLIDIVEHLLHGVYVLRPASARLKEATPPRGGKQKP